MAQPSAQHFSCSMQKWLDTEMTSNTNSGTTGKSNSEDSEEQPPTSSPTTTISSLEVPNVSGTSPLPNQKDSISKGIGVATKSYAMEDLLRCDEVSTSEISRTVTPLHSTGVRKVGKEESRQRESRKRPNEEFLEELSRTATDALTRALSKRATITESGIEQELKGIVREALELSLENMNMNGGSSQKNEVQQQDQLNLTEKHQMEKKSEKFECNTPTKQIPNSPKPCSYVPSPTEMFEAFKDNLGQSLSTYYEAACQALQSQSSVFPFSLPTQIRSQKFPETNQSSKSESSKLELRADFQRPTINHPTTSDQFSHQTEALALVVNRNRGSSASPPFEHQQENLQTYENMLIGCMPRKKRTKVTDTRLVPPKLPPQLPITSMDGGNSFMMSELPNSKIAEALQHLTHPPNFPINFDPSFMSDILKSLSMANGHHQVLCSNSSARGSFPLSSSNLSQIDLMGNLSPHLLPPPPPPSLPSQYRQQQHHHHSNAFTFDIPNSTASAVIDSNPIRRNRSIGGKRVTNTSSASNYGCDGRSFLSSSSTSEDGVHGLHPSPLNGLIPTTTTLTPVHLRKAKLMFFFTRYPNSNLLKAYFCDVKFQKNNTAQLVKWFSNFREFYYIQMEKYARMAISEGVRSPNELTVSVNSELYRALALHYNRNQQIEIPEYFRVVVETTMREFFVALSAGKDSEQSWKKPIYKIIARMDQPVPEYFKDPNWMAQLADG